MRFGFKFWVFAILAVLTTASFLLMFQTYQAGQYELGIKLMILVATFLAILLMYIWLLKSQYRFQSRKPDEAHYH